MKSEWSLQLPFSPSFVGSSIASFETFTRYSLPLKSENKTFCRVEGTELVHKNFAWQGYNSGNVESTSVHEMLLGRSKRGPGHSHRALQRSWEGMIFRKRCLRRTLDKESLPSEGRHLRKRLRVIGNKDKCQTICRFCVVFSNWGRKPRRFQPAGHLT